jgi:hypothetical protein
MAADDGLARRQSFEKPASAPPAITAPPSRGDEVRQFEPAGFKEPQFDFHPLPRDPVINLPCDEIPPQELDHATSGPAACPLRSGLR